MPNVIGDVMNILHNPHLQCLDDENHKDTYHDLGDDPQYVYHPIGTTATVTPLKSNTLEPRADNLLDIPTVAPLHYAPAERNLLTIEANYKVALIGLEWSYVQLKPNTRYLMKVTWKPDVRVTNDGTPESLRVRCRLDVYGQAFASDWHLLREGQIGTTQETLFLAHNWQPVLANIHAEFWLVNGGIDERVRVERVELIEVPNTFGTHYAEIGTPYGVPDDPPIPEPTGCHPQAWLTNLFPIQSITMRSIKMQNVPELPALLKSKRFWTAFIGMVFMVIINFWPEMEAHVEELSSAALLIVALLIGGYSLEDYANAKK